MWLQRATIENYKKMATKTPTIPPELQKLRELSEDQEYKEDESNVELYARIKHLAEHLLAEVKHMEKKECNSADKLIMEIVIKNNCTEIVQIADELDGRVGDTDEESEDGEEGRIMEEIDKMKKTQEIIVTELKELKKQMKPKEEIKDIIVSELNELKKQMKPREEIKPKKARTNRVPLYSAIVKSTQQKDHKIIIQEIKKTVAINSKCKINRLTRLANNTVKVDFDEEKTRDETILKLQKNQKIETTTAKKKNPMIILYGVEEDINSEGIEKAITLQNKSVFKEGEIKFRFNKKSGKENHKNVVLEVNPEIWGKVKKLQKLYLGYQAVRMKEFHPFVQCFKCLGFGHTTKHCEAKGDTCSHCAETHQLKNCKKRQNKESMKCYNCESANNKYGRNQDTNHSATSELCPRVRAMKMKVQESIDYGNEAENKQTNN